MFDGWWCDLCLKIFHGVKYMFSEIPKKENESILKEDKNMLGCLTAIKLSMVSNLNSVWEDARKINLILWLIKLSLCAECKFVS